MYSRLNDYFQQQKGVDFMEKTIDARGQACPRPLVMARDALKTLSSEDQLHVLVNDPVSAQNLEKMADQMNLPSKKVQQGTDYIVSMFVKKSFMVPQQEEIKCDLPVDVDRSFVVAVGSNIMGKGDEKLGAILIKGFIYSLTCLEKLPKSVIFYNSGVKLLAKGSESLADIKRLADAGVEILACGTCVEYYGLKKELGAGSIINMLEVVERQVRAAKVIRP